jgi:hypothetical protein
MTTTLWLPVIPMPEVLSEGKRHTGETGVVSDRKL